MEEGSVILAVPAMTSDFLKLCQLGDTKGVRNLVYPAEPVSPRSDDEEAEAEEEVEKEPAIDVNQLNEKGISALCLASRSGHVEVMKILIKAGADLEAVGEAGMRPIHFAANAFREAAIVTLIEAGADLNAKDNAGNTPLMWSAARGVLACSKLILEGGGDHKIVNNSGSSVIHRSAANGHVMMTKYWVVTKGIDVNTKDNNGNTPLHLGCMSNTPAVVEILMELGADASIKNKNGDTARDVAFDPNAIKFLE